MSAPLKTSASIVWREWPSGRGTVKSNNAERAWSHALNWFSDFGMSLDLYGDRPDAWADDERSDVWHFRVDSGPKSVSVRVTVDYDADGTPGEGWRDKSTCVSVEVRR